MILIYLQKNAITPFQIASEIRNFTDEKIVGIYLGSGINAESFDRSKYSDFNKVYFINDKKLENYSTTYYTIALSDFIKEFNPNIFLFPATVEGQDLAPRIAGSINCGLTADCTEIKIEDGKLLATRPTFGGELMATILSKTTPQMATIRPNTFKKTSHKIKFRTEFIEFKINLNLLENKVKILQETTKIKENLLSDAKIIVCGGKGLQNKANFCKLEKFAQKINAKIAVTRGLLDIGIGEKEIQIGQTGQSVQPEIYISFGVSGAIQHTVGMKNSKKIISINNDKTAPIFKISDIGIVADCNILLDELIK